MAFHVIPGGEEDNKHLSLYFFLKHGLYDSEVVWPFDGEVTITILNQIKNYGHFVNTHDWNDASDSVTQRPRFGPNSGWGERNLFPMQNWKQYLTVVDTSRMTVYIYFRVSNFKVRSSKKPYSWLVCSPDPQTK